MKWGCSTEKLCRAVVRICQRMGAALRVQGLRLGRALLQGGGVVSVLRMLIVLELCVLGVGVVRRLENSYAQALEANRAELAAIEAQALMNERPPTTGAAMIGGGDSVAPEEVEEAPGEAPALRPRDVATIISDETGDFDTAASLMAGEGASESAENDESVADQPNAEDDDEVDMLIRKGVAALIEGDMRRCILSLEQASALAPNHPAMLYYYGMAYDKLMNPRKAQEYYKKLFQMREQAGMYFERAARRLTYGVEQAAALRGKLAFGPHKVQHTYDVEQGERVSLLLPIMLAPGEEVRADEVYVHVQFFDMLSGGKVDFARDEPKAEWVNKVQNWENSEEDILLTYAVPPQEEGEPLSGGDVKYYGFVAKLYYKGEPMDCISSPSALILHEQRLNSRNRGWDASGLLPDDGLAPYAEEAVPYSEAYDEPAANDYP